MGVKLKKANPSPPSCRSALSATIFGGVATSVSIPLISPAKLSGIINRPGGTCSRAATPSTTGMKTATTPVELMNAPNPATASISKTISRVSLWPERRTSQSPT